MLSKSLFQVAACIELVAQVWHFPEEGVDMAAAATAPEGGCWAFYLLSSMSISRFCEHPFRLWLWWGSVSVHSVHVPARH